MYNIYNSKILKNQLIDVCPLHYNTLTFTKLKTKNGYLRLLWANITEITPTNSSGTVNVKAKKRTESKRCFSRYSLVGMISLVRSCSWWVKISRVLPVANGPFIVEQLRKEPHLANVAFVDRILVFYPSYGRFLSIIWKVSLLLRFSLQHNRFCLAISAWSWNSDK